MRNILPFLIFAALIYSVFFLRLDSFPVRQWDESMFAVNAYEMGHGDHSWFAPYYDGHVDYRSTKPLMLVWSQVLFIKIIGYNELAVRLPSALAGAAACIIVFFFTRRNFNTLWAWCSFLVLITSIGFTGHHAAQTGDADEMLALFLLLSNVFFYYFLRDGGSKNIFLYFFFLGMAFLCKSFAALLFIPAHIVLLAWCDRAKTAFKTVGAYAGAVVFIALSAGFMLLRDHASPGYWDQTIEGDVLRLKNVIELHREPFDFYFNNFFYARFAGWAVVAIAGLILLWKDKGKNIGQDVLSRMIFLLVSMYLLIISFAVTKLEWYDVPLYPYLAIAAGYSMYRLLSLPGISSTSYSGQMLILVLMFSVPLYYSIKRSHDRAIPVDEKRYERLSDFLYKKEKEGRDLNNLLVVNNGYDGHVLFYKYKLLEKGQKISIIGLNDLRAGSTVLAAGDTTCTFIRNRFNVTLLDTLAETALYKLQ